MVTVTVLNELRARKATLETQLEDVQERIDALTMLPHGQIADWQRGTAAARVVTFLFRHSLLGWSTAELIEATQCTEASVRSALTQLTADGDIEREWRGHYRSKP